MVPDYFVHLTLNVTSVESLFNTRSSISGIIDSDNASGSAYSMENFDFLLISQTRRARNK